MVWVPLFLSLLTYCTGTLAQFVMTQPPSVSASPGSMARISCTRSSGSMSSYYVSWYQQKPGSAPKLMIYQDSNRPTGIPDRFSGSTGSSEATFTISNVQPEDEGVYYCFSYDSNSFVFGGGTHLTVTGQAPVHPSVFLFPPSQEEIKTKSKATLVCLMDDFHPGVVQVEWKADGTAISSGVETTKPIKQGDKYVASSYLTLSESDWKSHNKYTCKVTHERETVEKVVNRSECS